MTRAVQPCDNDGNRGPLPARKNLPGPPPAVTRLSDPPREARMRQVPSCRRAPGIHPRRLTQPLISLHRGSRRVPNSATCVPRSAGHIDHLPHGRALYRRRIYRRGCRRHHQHRQQHPHHGPAHHPNTARRMVPSPTQNTTQNSSAAAHTSRNSTSTASRLHPLRTRGHEEDWGSPVRLIRRVQDPSCERPRVGRGHNHRPHFLM